jgi:predicted RND superfamily exporter protein
MSSAPPDRPKLGGKHRLLLRVERFSRSHYRRVFLLALLAVLAGSFLGSRLHLESNILALIPEGNTHVDALKDALEDFGSIDYLMVLLETREGQEADDLEDFADVFAEFLEEEEELVEFVDYRFELDADFLELFYENALLFLPPEDLPALAAKLSDEAIRGRIAEIRGDLSSPAGAFTPELIASDPLQLMPLFLNRLVGTRGVLQIDISDGYYLSHDGTTLIMLVKPVGPSQDLDFDLALMEAVHAAEAAAREVLLEEADGFADAESDGDGDGAGAEGPRVRYGGNYAVAVDEAGLIREDVSFNLFASMFAVSALYWLCYRRFAALLYSVIPLMIGQALTFGLAYFVLGGLNASSSAFTALLMGLGTDFVIVIYARYVEERQNGKTLEQATEAMIGETGLGVFTGAITSAGTFYAMCISQFRGLRDLGFLIGSGILLCAVAILFLLPAMIKWNEGVRRRKVDAVKKLHLQSFLLEHLIPFSARNRKLVVTVVAILTLGSAWLAARLEFDDTIRVLRSNRSAAYQVQQEITERFGAALSYMMAIAESESREEAVALTEEIRRRLQPFVDSGVIGSSDSILSYLPPESQQQQVLAALHASGAREFDAERVRATFVDALARNGLREEAFAGFLGRMQRFLSPERPIGLADLERQGLERLLSRYVASADGRVRVVTYMFLADPRWKREPPPGLVEALTGGRDDVVVTGTNTVSKEFRRIFNREAPRAVLLGLLVVFILLWVDFRSLKLCSVAMAQLVSGVVLMLGVMKLMDIHLNYVNAFVAVMILGVGIDYSIHLVHRMSMSGGQIEAGLLETGKAVVMAALTNIAGFFVLTRGNYPALRSFGWVALIGSLACLFTALTLVPALMARKEEDDD